MQIVTVGTKTSYCIACFCLIPLYNYRDIPGAFTNIRIKTIPISLTVIRSAENQPAASFRKTAGSQARRIVFQNHALAQYQTKVHIITEGLKT